eukprot:1958136-Prymnesium_polylepis.1
MRESFPHHTSFPPHASITDGGLHAVAQVQSHVARTAALGAREPLRHAHAGPPPSPARRLRRRPEPGPPQAQGEPLQLACRSRPTGRKP